MENKENIWFSSFSMLIQHIEEQSKALRMELASTAVKHGMESEAVRAVQERLFQVLTERDAVLKELDRVKAHMPWVQSSTHSESVSDSTTQRKNDLPKEVEKFDQLGIFLDSSRSDVGIQAELDFIQDRKIESLASIDNTQKRSEKSGLIRLRHPNRDFFLADMFDYALKDDGASMEAPIFTLSTKPDLSVWKWVSKDGSRSVNVTPSVLGRATQHDKDVLIYVVSQLTEALNRGRDDAKNRVVRFTVYDFLVTTNRGVGGNDYKRLQESFERLVGTRIKTDIRTGGLRVKENFGIIDRYKIVERSKDDERMIAVEITLSEWLYNAVQAHEVLTIHPDYFRLRKPIARRLYELARKHCGHQIDWKISLELLHEKSGSRGSLYEFHEAIKGIAADDGLPEYRVNLSREDRVNKVRVTFYKRDRSRVRFAIGVSPKSMN